MYLSLFMIIVPKILFLYFQGQCFLSSCSKLHRDSWLETKKCSILFNLIKKLLYTNGHRLTNTDLIWSFCFDLHALWSDVLEAKMLTHVIKFEMFFALSIRIKGFCIFNFFSQVVQYVWYGCNEIFNVKK